MKQNYYLNRQARRNGSITSGLLSIIGLVLLLGSCASIQTDIRYDTVPGISGEELQLIELRLVDLRANPNAQELAAIRSDLQQRSKAPLSEPLFSARLQALIADAALLAGNRREAEAAVRTAKAAYAGDELSLLAELRLLEDLSSQLELAESAIRSADSSFRLRAELGSLLLKAGRYREALAAFDSALPKLPPEYSVLYQGERDKVFALRDSGSSVEEASALHLTPQPISLLGMLIVVQQESSLLEWFTGGANWSPGVIFERAKAANWFSDPSAKGDSFAKRQDAALLIWNLLGRGQSAALNKYSVRYAARGVSPIPDVPYGHPAFDAILGLVEEEVMNLPDGRHFKPDDTVSGLEFFGIMTAAIKFR